MGQVGQIPTGQSGGGLADRASNPALPPCARTSRTERSVGWDCPNGDTIRVRSTHSLPRAAHLTMGDRRGHGRTIGDMRRQDGTFPEALTRDCQGGCRGFKSFQPLHTTRDGTRDCARVGSSAEMAPQEVPSMRRQWGCIVGSWIERHFRDLGNQGQEGTARDRSPQTHRALLPIT